MSALPKHTLPKYVTRDVTRSGTPRYRFQLKGAPKVRLPGEPGSPEFEAAYAAALTAKPKAPIAPKPVGPKPGSIDQLIIAYYGSSAFAKLAPSTRDSRRWLIERLRLKHGAKPARDLDAKHLADMLGKLSAVNQKNYVKMLRGLYAHAIATGLAVTDPSRGYKLPRIETTPYRRWENEDIERYQATHPIGTKARLALELMLHTGLRKADIIRLGAQHVRKGRITLKTAKTGTTIQLPLSPELAQILEATKIIGTTTFLVTKHGLPHTAKGFGNYMRDWCNEAGLPECSAHGIRHAVGCRLAEAGATTDEIMAVLGHTDPRMSLHYTKQANRARLADRAFARLAQ